MESGLKIQKYSSIIVVFVCFFLLTFALPMPLYAAGEIVGWGDNTYGKATPPDGNDYIAVAGGFNHSLALKSDGSIVCWGWTNYGLATPPDGNNYTAIAGGGIHSLALKSDGSIVGWGYDSEGQATPPAGNSYKAIAAGYEHSLALKTDGSIIGWGRDHYGQATPPDGNNYIAISAGGYHSLALKSDGSIAAWGYDNEGEVSNVPDGNDYIAISAGLYHNIALKSDGSMVGWGFDDHGRATPPAGNDYIAIASGASSSIALKSDGSIVAWGYVDYTPPAGNSFIAIASGGDHRLALKKNPYGGSGTLANPYKIATKADLLAMAASTGDYGKYFILTNNIDLGGQVFTTAIISPSNSPDGYYHGTIFTGVFDGDGHTITNFAINGGTTCYLGLFGFVGNGGHVKNLGVEYATISGTYAVAGLAATIEEGLLTNCYAAGSVSGTDNVGGLVGYSYKGTLTNCHANGSVTGGSSAGGLAGENYVGAITSCYATCSVSGSSNVGGLVGAHIDTATLTDCYATGSVTGTGNNVGGLVGINNDTGTITACYAAGTVSGTSYVGGLTGYSGNSTITSCYAIGSATGTDYVGGLAGYNTYCDILSSYATGSVGGTGNYIGGLAGGNSSGTLISCFWDTQTSGQATSAGGDGKTTAEMKTLSTFTDAGWDFVGETVNGPNDIWTMPAGGYPILSWQSFVTIGTGTLLWEFPLFSYYDDARTQTIYLASEIGGARTLVSLALDVNTPPGQILNSFTVRLKHTHLAVYDVNASNLWESTEWTTVYQSNETISAAGWTTFTFTTPFEYNGIDNLMVDISFNNSSFSTAGECRYSEPGGIRTIYSYAGSDLGDPLAWTGNGPPPPFSDDGTHVPNIRLGFIEASEVNVPDVVGMTQADANSAIIAAGLVVGTVTTDYNDSVAAGDVISQSPVAGTGVDPNTAVDIVVSLGRWLDLQVTKCSVTAGSKYLAITDKISLSGIMNATNAEMLAASQIVVTVDSADMAIPCIMTFPRNDTTYKKGSYNYTIKGATLRSSFKFSTKTGKFSFSAKNVDLSGLACPVTVRIQIGGSSGFVSLEEPIVNGTKKLIPYQLMMDVQNSLMADRVKVRRSSKLDSDSLTVSGRFTTAEEPYLDNPLVITVGGQMFTVSRDQFLSKNGVESCRNAVSDEGPLVTARLDYARCTFRISVRNAAIDETGGVDFGIDCFGARLSDPEGIDLGL